MVTENMILMASKYGMHHNDDVMYGGRSTGEILAYIQLLKLYFVPYNLQDHPLPSLEHKQCCNSITCYDNDDVLV